jgi:prolyl-tRNA editing enzyme YbaK/EbsC (Cys-tRNA(Pro) deacylase)
MSEYPAGVRRVAEVLIELGHTDIPIMTDESSHTAAEAADQMGVDIGQIVKSIVFRRKSDDAAVLVITSGANRVDEKKVSALVGKVGKADADFVKQSTGFTIGGVAPVGHIHQPVTLIDQDLFHYDVVWAAAGHPNSMLKFTPAQLEAYTSAPVVDIALAAKPTATA